MIGKHLEHQLLFKNINNKMTKEQIAIYLANRSGSTLIQEERKRQVSEEGYDWKNDDNYTRQELLKASITYIKAPSYRERGFNEESQGEHWPWDIETFKPATDNTIDSRIKELAKSGALIAAEIDRLQRAKVRAIYGKGAVDDSD